MSLRRRAARVVAATVSLLAFASSACAMGGPDCAPEDLAPVDAWLAKYPWHVGYTQADALVTAACKASPVDKNVLIVVAAYAQDQEFDKNVVVALVDTRADAVRAAFKGVIPEDAVTVVGQGGLTIDTSRYDLAPGVRAFGVDLASSGRFPAGAEFRWGTIRTLFVQDANALRPVLGGFPLTSWRDVPDTDHRGEASSWTIAIGPKASHGFADLVVTQSIGPTRDGMPGRRARSVLHYDGTAYDASTLDIGMKAIVPEPAASATARH